MPSFFFFFSILWDFHLFEKMVFRILFCLQYLYPLLLGPFRYYFFFFILYYSLISIRNANWYEIPSVILCLNS